MGCQLTNRSSCLWGTVSSQCVLMYTFVYSVLIYMCRSCFYKHSSLFVCASWFVCKCWFVCVETWFIYFAILMYIFFNLISRDNLDVSMYRSWFTYMDLDTDLCILICISVSWHLFINLSVLSLLDRHIHQKNARSLKQRFMCTSTM